MENQNWQTGLDALYLAACALHGQRPRRIPGDLTALYQFCKFHSITAIVAMALEDYWKEDPPADLEAVKPWKQAKEKAIRKNILLNAEREAILARLEAMGCWYMPLKGSLLQYDYPKFGMRQMSDNDILIDQTYRAAIRDLMRQRGYEVKVYGKGMEDEYLKQPVYNFEFHTALFFQALNPGLAAYYEDVSNRMEKDAGNGYGYHLPEEEFYIYLVAHGYKHLNYSGTGLRHLLDVWVYARKHPDLNWERITGELGKMGAADFEGLCRTLSGKLLDAPETVPELTAREREMLEAMITAGTYGTAQTRMEKRLGQGSKLIYLRDRLFPSRERAAVFYPILHRHPWLLPVIWIWRLLRAVFVAPGKVIRELMMLKKVE